MIQFEFHPPVLKSTIHCIAALVFISTVSSPLWAQKVYLEKLSNNAPIEIVEDISSPRQSLILVFHGGAGTVPKQYQGLTSVLSQMLAEGPSTITAEEYRKKLFLLNSSISVSSSPRAVYVSLTAPVESQKRVLDLAYDLVKNPKLDDSTFSIAHGKVLTSAKSLLDNMQRTTSYFAVRDAFRFHPDILDGTAAPTTVQKVNLTLIKEWHPKLLDWNRMSIATVGPSTKWKVLADVQTIMAKLKKDFSKDKSKKFEFVKTDFQPINPAEYLPSKLQVALIHKPKATDNQILYIFPENLKFDTKERLVGLVTHENLGGGLTGMLGNVLRTERGLTYHASSRADGQRPYWSIYSFGGIFQTQGLLAGIPEVVEKFKSDSIDPKNIDLAKQMNRTFFRSGMELPEDRLFSRLRLRLYGLNPNFIDEFEPLLSSVTLEEVNQFRSQKLNVKNGFLYIMGDKDQVLPVLEKVGIKGSEVKLVDLKDLI